MRCAFPPYAGCWQPPGPSRGEGAAPEQRIRGAVAKLSRRRVKENNALADGEFADYIPRMFHASDTPRTNLATYLRCLLEAVRRMLGGRWGFLMRPAAALVMGVEARQAMLQVAAAFEQLAVLLEQFRAGKLVPETPPEDALPEQAEATPREVAARPRPSMARREPRRRSPGSTPDIALPLAFAEGEGCIPATGLILATHVASLPLIAPFSRHHGRLCGPFFQKSRFGLRALLRPFRYDTETILPILPGGPWPDPLALINISLYSGARNRRSRSCPITR